MDVACNGKISILKLENGEFPRMKRLPTVAVLAIFMAASVASGAYAAAPNAVMALVETCCAACGIPCPCCP